MIPFWRLDRIVRHPELSMIPLWRLETLTRNPHIDVISVDVFDTLLLRKTRPEQARFWDIARAQRRELTLCGFQPIDRRSLFLARLLAARVAYRNAEPVRGQREPGFDDILRLLCAAVELPDDAHHALIAAEMSVEKTMLSGNQPLARILSHARHSGKRVVFASDMYLYKNMIWELIRHCLPELELDEGYVSSELGVSKRAGGLFDVLCTEEGVDPDRVAHIGDNRESDFEVPRSRGIHSIYSPRPRWWRAAEHTYARAFARVV